MKASDLDRLLEVGADLTSPGFLALVNDKLKEVKASNLEEQRPPPFGLDAKRLRAVRDGLKDELPAVLRTNAPFFDLDQMLARFAKAWSS